MNENDLNKFMSTLFRKFLALIMLVDFLYKGKKFS